MTLQPENNEIVNPEKKQTFEISSISVLEDLFYLGYTKSEKICIYKDEKTEINVVFRTVTPTELRDVFERSEKFDSLGAQSITEKIEILCRSIVTINDMPLLMDPKEKEDFHSKYDRDPTPLEQARYLLFNKVKSIF